QPGQVLRAVDGIVIAGGAGLMEDGLAQPLGVETVIDGVLGEARRRRGRTLVPARRAGRPGRRRSRVLFEHRGEGPDRTRAHRAPYGLPSTLLALRLEPAHIMPALHDLEQRLLPRGPA